jgi:endonuclease/exonuclease/phosphatase (EEP) superfamily protein YafD
MFADGDRGALATLILFGPRWIIALPWPLLATAALARERRLLVPLVVVGLLIVGPIMGYRVHVPQWRSPTPRVRVMTCNVNEDNFRTRSLAYLIATQEPDIVVLQEVSSVTKFIWPPKWNVVNRDEFIVASHWPVIEGDHADRPDAPTTIAAVRFVVRMPGQELQLFNVHLESPREGLEAVLSRTSGLDLGQLPQLDDMLRKRAAESAAVSEWIAGFTGPKLVVGDFNTPIESTIYRSCWSSLGNAFSDVGWGFGFTKTSQASSLSFGTRIDHLLYATPWRPVRCWVGDDIGSDHRPLLAEFGE